MLVKIGSLEKKALILLFGWMALGLAYSPSKQWKVLQAMGDEWEKTNQAKLRAFPPFSCEEEVIDRAKE